MLGAGHTTGNTDIGFASTKQTHRRVEGKSPNGGAQAPVGHPPSPLYVTRGLGGDILAESGDADDAKCTSVLPETHRVGSITAARPLTLHLAGVF